jgi:mannose/fructose/N-acetylgalactosamine-specific phosphotransferase system component IID
MENNASLKPKRNELPWTMQPGFSIFVIILLIAFPIYFFILGLNGIPRYARKENIGDISYLAFMLSLFLVGAIIGLFGIRARLRYLNTHWKRSKKKIYIKAHITEELPSVIPMLVAFGVGILIAFAFGLPHAIFIVFFGCLLILGALTNYLWWRSLPG